MSKMITLEIPQSEWEKLKEELIRTAAILKEQQRESEDLENMLLPCMLASMSSTNSESYSQPLVNPPAIQCVMNTL